MDKQCKAIRNKHAKIAKMSDDEKKQRLHKLETEAFVACWKLDDFKKRMSWCSVRLECIKELGYALVYFQYLHPDVRWGDQPARVKVLCDELAKEKGNRDPVYWSEFLDRIHEEIENLC
jgi:hypothetical protein